MALYDSLGRPVEEVAYGVQPVLSLDAVSAVTDGLPLDNTAARSNHLAAVSVSPGVTGGEIALDGSLDGVNFFLIGEPLTLASADADSTVPIIVQGTAVQFIRASILTAVVGGSVSVMVVSS
jgi:hypothetical protein